MRYETTHPSLLHRLQDSGIEEAWTEFDRCYREMILRYCRNRGLQASDAEDVCQATMLALTKRLPSFEYNRSLGRFRDYLGRIVHHAIIEHHRKSQRTPTPVADVPMSAEEDCEYADDLWEQEWVHHHYRLAMQTIRLTSDPRTIAVFEKLLVGVKPESIAADFGIQRDLVYKIKQRVRERLHGLIQEQVALEERRPRLTDLSAGSNH